MRTQYIPEFELLEYRNGFGSDPDREAETGGRGCRGFEIDSASYVRWVQRSLNRALRIRLAVDGRPGGGYRDAVRRLQQRHGLAPTGTVDPATQNALIRANEQNKAYVRWIQHQLNAAGAKLVIDGIKGRNTTAAVKEYQRKRAPDLCVDGFVGAKTELRLLQTGCGVPRRAGVDELALELDIEGLEHEKAAVAVRSRLCLFQNSSATTHRNHFQCGALRQARRIGAIGSPAGDCRRRVGATAYDTGSDIIASIRAAHRCLGRALDAVHIFSHGSASGVMGTTAGFAGLYRDSFSLVDRADGGRTASDVPTAPLSNRVVVVLHGCNLAAGTDNFARSLYDHLAASLSAPTVYGHRTSGCAGRNSSWRGYSKAHPTGRDAGSLPNIASSRCCGS